MGLNRRERDSSSVQILLAALPVVAIRGQEAKEKVL
jgi:hypothetical protein